GPSNGMYCRAYKDHGAVVHDPVVALQIAPTASAPARSGGNAQAIARSGARPRIRYSTAAPVISAATPANGRVSPAKTIAANSPAIRPAVGARSVAMASAMTAAAAATDVLWER